MDNINTPQIISKTPKYKLNEFVTVYDYEHLTTQEIISAIIEKINEIIDSLNALNVDAILQQIQDLINNFLLGLDADVRAIIIKMFQDGELDIYIEPIINRLLDVAIDNKLDLFLLTDKFKNKVIEIVDDMNLSAEVDINSIINTIEDLEFKRTKIAIYPFYTSINITENNTYHSNNLVYFNAIIKRGYNEIFNKNTLYKIGRLAYATENKINTLYATARATLTGEYTTAASAVIHDNGDIFVSTTSNATEILIGGTAPLSHPINGNNLIPTELPTLIEYEEFVEFTRQQIRDDLINNWGYVESLNEYNFLELENTSKNISVVMNNENPKKADEITIYNYWSNYKGVDETQRILRYMFSPEDAQFIIDNWTSRQDINLISIVVGEKSVQWRNQNDITIGFYTHPWGWD